MQMIFRGNLKDKQANAYREWEVKNRQALQETAPPGWIYAGTFFTVFGFGKHDVETRWVISSNQHCLERYLWSGVRKV